MNFYFYHKMNFYNFCSCCVFIIILFLFQWLNIIYCMNYVVVGAFLCYIFVVSFCLCISVSSKAHQLHIIHFNIYIFHPLVCFQFRHKTYDKHQYTRGMGAFIIAKICGTFIYFLLRKIHCNTTFTVFLSISMDFLIFNSFVH